MKLVQILHYPLKAARAVELVAANVQPRGLEGDRRWMLVDASGRFLSQRECSRLALIDVSLHGKALEVCLPDGEAFIVPPPDSQGERARVQIWRDDVEALVAGAAANKRFSRFLGQPVRLVYMDEAARRPVDPVYAREGEEVSFADGFPLLLTNTASLAALNQRLERPIGMERFRPNLVVEGSLPFDEDRWERIQIGAVTFRVVKPCARCVVTTVDQATGQAGKEPLRTLATFRKVGSEVFFGQNLIPVGRGIIRAGEPAIVAARRATPNLPLE